MLSDVTKGTLPTFNSRRLASLFSRLSGAGSLCLVILLLTFVPATKGQNQIPPTNWKEYQYVKARFAMTFPYEPKPHPDRSDNGILVLTVGLTPSSAISIRVKQADNCDATLRARFQKPAPGSPKKKVVSVSGHDGYEYERPEGRVWVYQRNWCGDGFVFFADSEWPVGDPKPPGIARIVNSFRLIPGGQ
jgi:hypothetical protein